MFKKIVLMYHFVAKEGQGLEGTFPLTDKEFIAQITALKERNFSFGKVSQIKEPVDNHTVYFTFDDSTIDQYNYAMPILEAMNVPAHFSIITNPFENVFPLAHRLQLKLIRGSYPALPPIDSSIEKRADEIYHFEQGMRRYCKYIYNIHLTFQEADKMLGEPQEKYIEELKIRFMMPEHIKKINYDLFEIGCHTKTHAPLNIDYKTFFQNEILDWEKDMQKHCPEIPRTKVFTYPLKNRIGSNVYAFAEMFKDQYPVVLDHSNELELIKHNLYPDPEQTLYVRYDSTYFQDLIDHGII